MVPGWTSECMFFRNVSGVHLDAWFPSCLPSGCVHYREGTCKGAGRRPQPVVLTANCCIGVTIRSLLRKMMSAKPVPLSQADRPKHQESKCLTGTQWVLQCNGLHFWMRTPVPSSYTWLLPLAWSHSISPTSAAWILCLNLVSPAWTLRWLENSSSGIFPQVALRRLSLGSEDQLSIWALVRLLWLPEYLDFKQSEQC